MYDGVPEKIQIQQPETVRVATIADEVALYKLLLKLEPSNDMGFKRDDQKVWAHVNTVCRGTGGVAGVIDGPNGTLIGSIGITASQPWYSSEWFLSEVWCFVDPAYRKGTRYGEALFEFARWHQQDLSQRVGRNLPLEISFLSYRRVAAKDRLWRRLAGENAGGRWIGSTFLIGAPDV